MSRPVMLRTLLIAVALAGAVHGHALAQEGMMGGRMGAEHQAKMEEHRAKMEEHRAQMESHHRAMQEARARLDSLIVAMDAARGDDARTEAIAAVVRELVAQHRAMLEHMSVMMGGGMHGGMGRHGEGHPEGHDPE